MKSFEALLKRLQTEIMEQIIKGTMVECVGNEVYEDDDLYEFLDSIGANLEEFGASYAVVSTNEGEYYEIPYEDRPNRFGDDLPDETILIFEYERIYDVTKDRK